MGLILIFTQFLVILDMLDRWGFIVYEGSGFAFRGVSGFEASFLEQGL